MNRRRYDLARVRLSLALAIAASAAAISACSGGQGSGISPAPQAPQGLRNETSLHEASRRPNAAVPCAPTSSLTNFNSQPLAAGSTIWFSVVFDSGGYSDPETVGMHGAAVSFTANGKSYGVTLPNGQVTYLATATSETASFVNSTWVGTTLGTTGRHHFLTGAAFVVPTGGLPGGIKNVKFVATPTSTDPGMFLNWYWSAAVYSQFASNYNSDGIKFLDGPTLNAYANNDAAGTPEIEKTHLLPGAMSLAPPNYAGTLVEGQTVFPCVTAPPATPSPTPTSTPTPNIADGTVYVMNSDNSGSATTGHEILVDQPSPLAQLAITTMNGGAYQTYGSLTFDLSGNLWVDTTTPDILEFAAGANGNATPSRVITPANTNAQQYWGIAVDATGAIYAEAAGFPNVAQGQIDVYSPTASGVSTPVRSFTGPEMSSGRKLVIDAHGNLWTVGETVLAEYAPSSSGTVSPLVNMTSLSSCTIDWPFQPRGIAFDSQGNMLVATVSTVTGGAIVKFSPPFAAGMCPSAYIHTALAVNDISVDDKGNIYGIPYTIPNEVDTYAESAMTAGYPADFNSAPTVAATSVISGASSGLNGPVAIAVWSNATFLSGNARKAKR